MSQEKEKKSKKVGFIGVGRIGSALVRGFVVLRKKEEGEEETKVLDEKNVFVTDENEKIVEGLKLKLGVQGRKDNISLTRDSDVIFLCVEPDVAEQVIDEIKDELNQDKCLVSVVAGLPVSEIKKKVEAQVVAVIPTTIAEVRRGFSLVHFSAGVKPDNEEFIKEKFGEIGEIVDTTEEQFGVYLHLTSCGPAFIAVMMAEFAKVVHEINKTVLSKEEAEEKAKETMIGTALLLDRGMSFEELWKRVETPDGITRKGTRVLKKKLPRVFKKVLKRARIKLKKRSK